jgi:hypothetical protein
MIECPKCGKDIDIDQHITEWLDDDLIELECPHCWELFKYQIQD